MLMMSHLNFKLKALQHLLLYNFQTSTVSKPKDLFKTNAIYQFTQSIKLRFSFLFERDKSHNYAKALVNNWCPTISPLVANDPSDARAKCAVKKSQFFISQKPQAASRDANFRFSPRLSSVMWQLRDASDYTAHQTAGNMISDRDAAFA